MTFEFHRHNGVDGYHLHVGLSGSRHLAAGERDDLGRDSKSHDYGKLHSRRMHWYQAPSRRVEDRVVGLVMLLLAVPLFATGARRLHDSGKSGWWQLLALIPVAGWIVLLIFFLIPGDETANKFGPPPNSGEPVNTH